MHLANQISRREDESTKPNQSKTMNRIKPCRKGSGRADGVDREHIRHALQQKGSGRSGGGGSGGRQWRRGEALQEERGGGEGATGGEWRGEGTGKSCRGRRGMREREEEEREEEKRGEDKMERKN